MSVKQRALPAVAAALVAAGGIVWVTQHREDYDHVLRGEINTSSTAVMVFVVRSGWRGVIAEFDTGVSRFHAEDVGIAAGEPIEVVLLGQQESGAQRQQVSCTLLLDGARVDHRPAVVRSGDKPKTVKCQFKS